MFLSHGLYAQASTWALVITIVLISSALLTVYKFLLQSELVLPLPQNAEPVQQASLLVDGRTRSFSYLLPRHLKLSPELLIVFHGGYGTPEQIREYTGFEFEDIANDNGFIVVYPAGVGGNWNTCQKSRRTGATLQNVDDVGFTRAIVNWFVSRYGVDKSKVFAVGFSNGGHMCYRLALEKAVEFAGFAVIAANLPDPADSRCPAIGGPTPLIVIAGSNDPINPYRGGALSPYGLVSFGKVLSAIESALSFVPADARPSETTSIETHADGEQETVVEKRVWGLHSNNEVILLCIRGGGHTIPQRRFRFARIYGHTSRAISAPEEIWHFFSRALELKHRVTDTRPAC
jgi:polyhydroxybutyrate depolymerase